MLGERLCFFEGKQMLPKMLPKMLPCDENLNLCTMILEPCEASTGRYKALSHITFEPLATVH
jgi:hypothetical protein